MINTIKLLIVDDHQMFIDGLKALLYREENISIIAEEERRGSC